VWGGKSVNETWFSRAPEMVHGINWLPMHGGSLYLGLYPDYVKRNYDALVAEKAGAPFKDWADLIWMYRALQDPEDALRQFDAAGEKLPREAGNSAANAYHWICSLASLGQVDRLTTADYPVHAVFRRGAQKTYTVCNYGDQERTVTFSDGVKLKAALNRAAMVRVPPSVP
jgi:hypothetical protein